MDALVSADMTVGEPASLMSWMTGDEILHRYPADSPRPSGESAGNARLRPACPRRLACQSRAQNAGCRDEVGNPNDNRDP